MFANNQSQETGRQLLRRGCAELYGNENVENELCPGNQGFSL